MPQLVDVSRSPFGLSGGTILSGSVSSSADAFWYYPVVASVATVKFSNISGPTASLSYTAGIGVYGAITSVTQSSGYAILYSGSYPYPLP